MMNHPASDPVRNIDLAKIHLAKKDLGLDDAAYATMLQTATGLKDVTSAGALNGFQRLEVIQHCIQRGWKPKARKNGTFSPASAHLPRAEKFQCAKIRAIWITLHKAGVIHNGSEEAIGRFSQRITGKALKLEALDSHQANSVIEALKSWAHRENITLETD